MVHNDLDRYRLVTDVIDRVPHLGEEAALLLRQTMDHRSAHRHHIGEGGDDMRPVTDWPGG